MIESEGQRHKSDLSQQSNVPSNGNDQPGPTNHTQQLHMLNHTRSEKTRFESSSNRRPVTEPHRRSAPCPDRAIDDVPNARADCHPTVHRRLQYHQDAGYAELLSQPVPCSNDAEWLRPRWHPCLHRLTAAGHHRQTIPGCGRHSLFSLLIHAHSLLTDQKRQHPPPIWAKQVAAMPWPQPKSSTRLPASGPNLARAGRTHGSWSRYSSGAKRNRAGSCSQPCRRCAACSS